jgi:hypothetical protein
MAFFCQKGNDEGIYDNLSGTNRSLSIRCQLKEVEDFVMRHLGNIHSLLTGDVQRTKSELSKHCTEITLTPDGQTDQVSGDWNLLGGCSDGAGGLACTILPQATFFVDFAA